MSHTGAAERAAVLAQLGTIGGGKVTDSLSDAAVMSKEGRPYLFASFGQPVPVGGTRTMAESAAEQPHRVRFMVQAIAHDHDAAQRLDDRVRDLLVGWSANATSTEVEGLPNIGVGPDIDIGPKPTIYRFASRFTFDINL